MCLNSGSGWICDGPLCDGMARIWTSIWWLNLVDSDLAALEQVGPGSCCSWSLNCPRAQTKSVDPRVFERGPPWDGRIQATAASAETA